jgi:hypothetical protein
MKRTRKFLLLALASVLFTLAQPAFAQCEQGDEDCPLIPPQSREITTNDGAGAGLETVSDGQVNSLQPVDVPPPPFVLNAGEPDAGLRLPASTFNSIDVRLRLQAPGDNSCGVQALGMALDGLEGIAPKSDALVGYLNEQGYLYEGGTGVEELTAAARYFGYSGSYPFYDWKLGDLRKELEAGRPVVVDLGRSGENVPGHFVTVTGISDDGAWIGFNDPTLGERMMSSAAFDELWRMQGHSGVAVAHSTPVPADPGFTGWMAATLAMMATLALAPDFLRRRKWPGVGGAIESAGPGSTASTFIGDHPPYDPPAGMAWVNQGMQYQTRWRSEIVYTEIPRMKLKQVQVGTELEKIPYTKRILVDNGHWVTDYRTEKYIRSYRSERYIKSYRQARYVKYYRMKRLPRPFGRGYDLLPVPVYGYRSVPVYGSRRVPVYGYRQVEVGKHWQSEWVYEEFTAYKTVEKPVYENRLVQVGVERVPEEVRVEERVPIGYLWELQPAELNADPGPLTEDELLREMRDLRITFTNPRLMLTTAPLRIRQSPGADTPALTIAAKGEVLLWTGEVRTIDGADWYQVRYKDPAKGLMIGWVHSAYLVPRPPQGEPAEPESAYVPSVGMESLAVWRHLLTADERQAYLQLEKSRLDALWSEILRLTRSSGGSGKDPAGLFIQEEKPLLLTPPEWYLQGGMPDSFGQDNLLTEELVETLRLILLHPECLSGEVTERTWGIIAAAFHVTPADLKTHVLSQVSWKPESATTVGEYPLTLYVTRRHGHYLLSEPAPEGENVSEAFLGVPGGEQVEWTGTYQVGLDSAGERVVYYYVSWEFNGKTYQGWIPNQYLAPEVEGWDPQAGIPGEHANPTFGYGDGVEGWAKYHAGGAAQNLNLRLLLKDLGYPEEIFSQYPAAHHNLCGQLAVMEALGVSLEEGFLRAKKLEGDYTEILQSPSQGTDPSQLEDFIKSFIDYGWDAATLSSSINEIPIFVNQNRQILALVTIDTRNDGVINKGGDAAHWVHVISIENEAVQYYNPYTNTVQSVATRDFEAAWEYTPGNTGSFTSVVASQ